MNQHKHTSDLHEGRGWLNRAAEMLDGCEDHVSDAEFATAAAAIGNGFVQLALAAALEPVSLRLTSEMPPELAAAVMRAQRAEAEARPHDDEPECTTADVPCRCAIPPTGSQEHLPPCPAFVAAREADRG